jgi:predicted permease
MYRLRHFRSDEDIRRELASLLEQAVEDELAGGLPEAEARRRARLRFGSELEILEKTRDQEPATMIESCYRDFLTGLRALRKTPLLCVTTIVTLALGIGANTAVFTLLYGLVLRSLPVERPWELARFGLKERGGQEADEVGTMPWLMLQEFRREQRSFSDISSWHFDSVTTEDRDGTMRMYDAMFVSGNGFRMLGVRPYVGRLIGPADDVRGGPAGGWPVVLSYGFWNERFRRDPDVVGKKMTLSGVPVTVAGVAPPDFEGIMPGRQTRCYLPLRFSDATAGRPVLDVPENLASVFAIGRLKPGVGLAQANAELATARDPLFKRFIPPKYEQLARRFELRVISGRGGVPFLIRSYTGPLTLMQGLVIVVLVLCCVNVGGLMMSKMYARQHEFAVRSAIGAGRWRLMRQYLTESAVIALAGAALGGAAAWFGTPFLLRYFINPYAQEALIIHPDSMLFLASAALAILSTLLFGTLPAWRAGRSDPGSLLKSRSSLGARRQAAGRAFVPVQVALSLVLVTVAGLLSQSLIRIRSQHAGFALEHITLTTPILQKLPQKGDAMLDLYQRVVDRLEQKPGIEAAAVTYFTPLTNRAATAAFEAAGGGPNPRQDPRMAHNDVGPGYFRTMETRIVSGREFERRERDRSVCVLNQSAASFLFPGQDPIGQSVTSRDTQAFAAPVSCRVIGVAEDAKFASMRDPAPRTVYFPVSLDTPALKFGGNLVFLMRSRTAAQAIAGYRAAHDDLVPSTPLLRFATLHEQMDEAMGMQRMITTLSSCFGGLALFLSAIGLYGLLASSVAQRTGEIGLRLALGAGPRRVLSMILREAAKLISVGFVLGAAGLWIAVRFVREMLFGVTAFDAATLAATVFVLASVGLAAALIPALRAARVNPNDALRAE